MKALRIQLAHMTHKGTAASPHLEPAPGIAALHDYGRESLNDLDAALANQSGSAVESMFRHQILIWELAVALWGSLPEFEHLDGKFFFSFACFTCAPASIALVNWGTWHRC